MLVTGLTVGYLTLFSAAAVPGIARIIRRGSSADLSIWREIAVLAGIGMQFAVFLLAGVRDWRVLVSPVASGVSIGLLLTLIMRYRQPERKAGTRHPC